MCVKPPLRSAYGWNGAVLIGPNSKDIMPGIPSRACDKSCAQCFGLKVSFNLKTTTCTRGFFDDEVDVVVDMVGRNAWQHVPFALMFSSQQRNRQNFGNGVKPKGGDDALLSCWYFQWLYKRVDTNGPRRTNVYMSHLRSLLSFSLGWQMNTHVFTTHYRHVLRGRRNHEEPPMLLYAAPLTSDGLCSRQIWIFGRCR
jgi:hypothetical protein